MLSVIFPYVSRGSQVKSSQVNHSYNHNHRHRHKNHNHIITPKNNNNNKIQYVPVPSIPSGKTKHNRMLDGNNHIDNKNTIQISIDRFGY
mmetsp:Transcript_18297/g.18493  ORF Transcript_18297/g.18493 Transcript_18297/m.18493 type:complete len:90 (-) Transcript_18297:949-1218(-)